MNKDNMMAIPLHTIDYMTKNLTSNEFLILIFLWRWSVSVGTDAVKTSNKDIATLTKISRPAVTKAINNLILLRLIIAIKKKNKPSLYYINLEKKFDN